jgi:hypothetical protein
MARMMICATARITGSEEWRKSARQCDGYYFEVEWELINNRFVSGE